MTLCLGLAAQATAQDKQPSLKELLPRIKPLKPADAVASLQVEPGFRVELVAAEPDVTDPVAVAFDENGRMFVAEMRGYPSAFDPSETPLGRLRLLEDRDGDGRFEHSCVFADRVHWPSGIACFKQGIFVAAPPQILYLKDTDGDGAADVRRVVYDGFGTAASEDIMNNLKWGLDNWIYGGSSYNGGQVRRPDQENAKAVSVRGRDFRFHPQTKVFQPLAGTGDFGNCFDDWGNRFVSNAGMLLIHPVLPGTYLARNPHLSPPGATHRAAAAKREMYSLSQPEPWRVVRKKFWDRWVNTTREMRASRFSERELATGGYVTGGAGAAIYRGHVFPAEYRGNSFTAEPAGNVVIRLQVKPKGVTFDALPTSDQREFLASPDNWFRPVNVANGPDGGLYVLDMYREIIEDPSAIPEDILKLLDVTSGRDRGRIYRVVPDNFQRPRPPRLGQASTAELVKTLEHPSGWWRQTAQRLLFERQDAAAIPPLNQIVRQSDLPQARLHALWTLAGLEQADEPALTTALADPHPSVREHAVRIAEARLNRSQAIRDRVVALANDPAPRVRLQVAFSLGELTDPQIAAAALARIAQQDGDDVWMRTAILSSSSRNAALLFEQLAGESSYLKQPAAEVFLAELARLIGTAGRPAEVTQVLQSAGSRSEEQPRLSLRIVKDLAVGLDRSGHELAEMIPHQPQQVQDAVQRLFARAAETARDPQQPAAERAAVLELLRFAPWPLAAEPLAELLSASQPAEVQLAAVQALSAHKNSAVAKLLVDRWSGLSPAVRREAAEALLRRSERVPVLLAAMEAGRISPRDLDDLRQQALLKHPSADVRKRAAKLLESVPRPSRKQVLKHYASAATLPGDLNRGKQLFEKTCAACHAVDGRGKQVGPDLTTVQNRSAEQILLAVLDPNREVKPQYVNYQVVTADGRTFTGIIVDESSASITLRRAEAAQDTVLRSNIEVLHATGLSLMPEGIEKTLTPQQLADVIAYVRSLGKQAGQKPRR